jgi:putative transposase
MTNIRRYYDTNDIVFTTHVTYKRSQILIKSFDLLWQSISDTYGDNLMAWVVLPDHIHILTENRNSDLSVFTKKMKLSYSTNYRKLHNLKSGRIWQYRFYDHIIRNQDDLNNHIDYIHYNPVKHGFVNDPFKWKYSSISKYQEYYGKDWGVKEKLVFDGNYGE